MKVAAPVVFKYLDLPYGLGGRGGAQRFFLLANQIPFTEDLVSMSEWGSVEKARVVTSGENPGGTLPILYTATGETLTGLIHDVDARSWLALPNNGRSVPPVILPNRLYGSRNASGTAVTYS